MGDKISHPFYRQIVEALDLEKARLKDPELVWGRDSIYMHSEVEGSSRACALGIAALAACVPLEKVRASSTQLTFQELMHKLNPDRVIILRQDSDYRWECPLPAEADGYTCEQQLGGVAGIVTHLNDKHAENYEHLMELLTQFLPEQVTV